MNAAIALIAEALDLAINKVPHDASIESLEEWDSLGHMRIIIAIEQRLARSLETEELLEISDVRTIHSLLAG